MERIRKTTFVLTLAAAMAVLFVTPVVSQDKPVDNMQILRDKIKADKKLIVAANMELTEPEAKAFWPVYEAYQKELAAINQRIGSLIGRYAEAVRNKAFTDKKAKQLTTELLHIQKAEAELQASYLPKLSKALPPKKVARYLQIENKIRAVVKYELAAEIPLVE